MTSFAPDPSLTVDQKFALAVGALDARRLGLGHHWLHGLPPGTGARHWAREVLWHEERVLGPVELAPKFQFIINETREKTPLARVISRAVYLAQLGAAAGYLPDSEAWSHIIRSAKMAHATFGSWEHFGRSVIQERLAFKGWEWLGERNIPMYEELLDPASLHSPWNQNPWPDRLSLTPPRLRDELPPAAPELPALRRFAMALSAPLVPLCGGDFDHVEQGPPGSATWQLGYGLLAGSWSVTTRTQAHETLEWLATEGHRAGYRKIAGWILETSTNQRRPPHAVVEDLPEQQRATGRIVARHLTAHPTIPAFDLARVGSVARAAMACGMLEPHEAWKWMEDTARVTARAFDSWADFAKNYAVGFAFHSKQELPASGLFEIEEWLITSPRSPWRRIPWGDGT
jgi:hypothetical protein